MKTQKVKIIDPIGIHARPASQIVSTASKFKSEIMIKTDTREANAKSIMNLMSLAAKFNTEITIVANGIDESEAVDALVMSMKAHKLV